MTPRQERARLRLQREYENMVFGCAYVISRLPSCGTILSTERPKWRHP